MKPVTFKQILESCKKQKINVLHLGWKTYPLHDDAVLYFALKMDIQCLFALNGSFILFTERIDAQDRLTLETALFPHAPSDFLQLLNVVIKMGISKNVASIFIEIGHKIVQFDDLKCLADYGKWGFHMEKEDEYDYMTQVILWKKPKQLNN